MTLKERVAGYISEALKEKFDVEIDKIPMSYPDKKEFGDYATPVALSLAKELKKNPREIANVLSEYLGKKSDFDKIEVAGPGFVNFFLSTDVLDKEIKEIVADTEFGKNDALKGRRVLLEYVSANPTGPLHIGHGRWAAIGDSMARILKFSGAEVATENYVNDAGNQIKLLNESISAVREGKEVPENGYHGDYVAEVAAQMKDGDEAKDIILETQKKTLSNFKVEFDNYFSELSLHQSDAVNQTIDYLKSKNLTYEQDGALWFRTTGHGDDKDRVLIKADGNYTYFAVDIAYHRNKITRKFDELVNVFGADHHGYVKRLSAAVALMDENVKLNVIIGQLVNLFREGTPVRMSKRTGDIISLDEVIEEIGVDATRYFLVMRKTDTHLDFDLEEAKKQSEDNPVFYVQYAYARISGILRNAEEQGVKADDTVSGIVDSPEARDVLMELIKFPETLADIAVDMEPHRVPMYLENLAGVFHRFYHHHRVLGDDAETTSRRLHIVYGVRNVLRTGLSLIGVNAPEKM